MLISYIPPTILISPFCSISARTGLEERISAMVISTFFFRHRIDKINIGRIAKSFILRFLYSCNGRLYFVNQCSQITQDGHGHKRLSLRHMRYVPKLRSTLSLLVYRQIPYFLRCLHSQNFLRYEH